MQKCLVAGVGIVLFAGCGSDQKEPEYSGEDEAALTSVEDIANTPIENAEDLAEAQEALNNLDVESMDTLEIEETLKDLESAEAELLNR